MKRSARFVLYCLPAILAACEPGTADPGPEPATIGETRALEQAAEMIEEGKARSDASGDSQGQAEADGSPAQTPVP